MANPTGINQYTSGSRSTRAQKIAKAQNPGNRVASIPVSGLRAVLKATIRDNFHKKGILQTVVNKRGRAGESLGTSFASILRPSSKKK